MERRKKNWKIFWYKKNFEESNASAILLLLSIDIFSRERERSSNSEGNIHATSQVWAFLRNRNWVEKFLKFRFLFFFFKVKSHVCTRVTDGIKLKYLVERHLNTIPTLSNCLSTTAATTGLTHGKGQNIRHIIHSDLHTKQLTSSNVSLAKPLNETVQVSYFFTYSNPCMLFFSLFFGVYLVFSHIFVSLFNLFVENIA